MENLTMEDLMTNEDWKSAIIVFTQDTFTRSYTEQQRSYRVYRTAKYFNRKMIGNSLFGEALDGSESGVRLDHYIHDPIKPWKIEKVYLEQSV